MKVKDLIEALQSCDPEKPVIFRTLEEDYQFGMSVSTEDIRQGDLTPYDWLTLKEADTPVNCVVLFSDEVAVE